MGKKKASWGSRDEVRLSGPVPASSADSDPSPKRFFSNKAVQKLSAKMDKHARSKSRDSKGREQQATPPEFNGASVKSEKPVGAPRWSTGVGDRGRGRSVQRGVTRGIGRGLGRGRGRGSANRGRPGGEGFVPGGYNREKRERLGPVGGAVKAEGGANDDDAPLELSSKVKSENLLSSKDSKFGVGRNTASRGRGKRAMAGGKRKLGEIGSWDQRWSHEHNEAKLKKLRDHQQETLRRHRWILEHPTPDMQ
jgi:hypothetical protein